MYLQDTVKHNYCPNCGTKNSGYNYCPSCGKTLSAFTRLYPQPLFGLITGTNTCSKDIR